ncbi:FAD-binding domain-containing protein [Xylaria cf. heliscus]|nr:FAD-binding domain-containing protein [Xylaria cf. heliscus]
MGNSSRVRVLEDSTTVLRDAIILPGSEEYKQANGSYFSEFENELEPWCIAKPSDISQVQNLITTLRPHVLSRHCRVAIRGAGHTPFPGSSNVQDGVTIDMRRLNGITLNEDKSIVEIGVGKTGTTVYTELERHSLTVPGGRVGRIGVTRFILGGKGLSIFSTRTGFACDSVTEFQIVLASSEIVCANDQQNSDLLWALKGGLNNFGVVTSFKMKTIKARDIWGGITYYVPGAFAKLLEEACDFVENETDEDAHIMCSIGYGFGQQAVSCVMYHTRGEENPISLQRFTSIEPQIPEMCSMRTSTQLEFSEELSKFFSDGLRQYWASITIHADVSLMKLFHDIWQETLAQIKDAQGFIFSFGFHPLTKTLLENSEKAGSNAAAILPSEGPLFVLLVNPVWELPDDDQRIFEAEGNLMSELRAISLERGLLHRYIFTNYGFGGDDVLSGYGEQSVAKLVATSKRVDPLGMFQKGFPGGFKLPTMTGPN